MFNKEERREEFLKVIAENVHYWDEVVEGYSQKERLEGLAFSILSYIDGSSGDCHFLIPAVETEKGATFNIHNNIAGSLHDHFFDVYRKYEHERKESYRRFKECNNLK